MAEQHFHFMQDYRDEEQYRHSFNRLAQLMFRIDFEEWYRRGLWDESYRCYSFRDGDEVVANASTSRMDICVQGRKIRGLQIGAVMTHPDYRRRGLSSQLLRTILEEQEDCCDIIFLFANKGAVGFYPQFGFVPVQESRFVYTGGILPAQSEKSRKLDLSQEEDYRLLLELAARRAPVSSVFGAEHADTILMWHALNIYPENIRYFEDEQVAVISQTADSRLEIYDVIGAGAVHLLPLLPDLVQEAVAEVEFFFTPEFPDIQAENAGIVEGDTFFVKTAISLPDVPFRFPATAQT